MWPCQVCHILCPLVACCQLLILSVENVLIGTVTTLHQQEVMIVNMAHFQSGKFFSLHSGRAYRCAFIVQRCGVTEDELTTVNHNKEHILCLLSSLYRQLKSFLNIQQTVL